MPKRRQKDSGAEGRSVYWKKRAAKNEHEELKEGAWLEPARALLRRKATEDWTDKHRNEARKILSEGGWTQKRDFSIFAGRIISQC